MKISVNFAFGFGGVYARKKEICLRKCSKKKKKRKSDLQGNLERSLADLAYVPLE